jgi:hypothetical protein
MTPAQLSGYSRPVMKGLQYASAFVIQFRGVDQSPADRFSGRVEHVKSGRTALFHAVEEVPQILLKMLEAVASDNELGTDELA